ncbi:MAG: M3 family peptidase [Alphaproteobacteria bacterium]|nr:M3 family peptidase [Alphaproteobacteria bacterium]
MKIRNTIHLVASLSVLAAATGCGQSDAPAARAAAEAAGEAAVAIDAVASAEATASNPLLAEWAGPYGGVPAFDKMKVEDFKSALEAGMAEQLAEIDVIADNPEPPTFDNTILELERAGATLGRVFAYWGVTSSNLSSPAFRDVQQEMAPRLSEFFSKINQNEKLFARVKAVHDSDAVKQMRPDQQRLVRLVYDGFARNGATLDGAAKARYADINKRLAELHTTFANNVLHDEESYVTYLSADDLGGLSQAFIDAAATAASDRGREGEYAILNTRSSMDPFLTFSTERDLREKVWRTYYDRGDNGDEFDNNAIIAEILKLRDERVGLLGYETYADWRLEDRMAKTPERAMDLMMAVWPAAIGRVAEEVADMQAIVDAEGGDFEIAPWDYRFYSEKVRKAKYDLDSDEVKQYLQLDNLREGLFYVAGELFGFAFEPVEEGSVPVFHPDVKVWEVTDRQTGEHVGLWYLDPFARAGKRSGAWATSYRSHETFDGKKTPLGSNNSNFVKAADGEPVLVSYDDAETLFHEFGHALHYLSSNVAYPTLNGGVRDYTEFQSQLLERWLLTDEVIDRFLVHYRTGEPIPDALVAKIKAAKTFNQGFQTTEYLASAIIDMKLHTADPKGLDPDAFERRELEKLGMPSAVVMRHRTPHFGHAFSGEGYSAGYYGYMWADVLTSDAAEAFAEAPGGLYDDGVAEKLVTYLFAPRNSIDPAEAYLKFRGSEPSIAPLMRDRGFPIPAGVESGGQ